MEAGLGGDKEQQLGKDQGGKGQGDRPQQPTGTGLTGNTIVVLLGTTHWPYWDPTMALLRPQNCLTGNPMMIILGTP